MESLIGNMASFNAEKINDYFKGRMIAQLSSLITEKMVGEKISILEINAHLMMMSDYCQVQLTQAFRKYGIELVDFSFMSINVPQEDPSFKKLKESIDKAAQLKIVGRDIYQMDRSFDVMEQAASNEGSLGTIANMGMGLGMGVQVGNQMGTMFNQNLNTNVNHPSLPHDSMFYVAVDGKQQGPFDKKTIGSHIKSGQINSDTLIWKQGMPSWARISTLIEFSQYFQSCPPPIPPTL